MDIEDILDDYMAEPTAQKKRELYAELIAVGVPAQWIDRLPAFVEGWSGGLYVGRPNQWDPQQRPVIDNYGILILTMSDGTYTRSNQTGGDDIGFETLERALRSGQGMELKQRIGGIWADIERWKVLHEQ